ncbi:helix-turn-helix domain-containing protein [Paenibacillus sp. GCM10023252]|uniref:helix-turn-helix domain-containing protein n=1 Tax=Paenibacillus sp. GCM10023252 TaxID=3252649 RepID=UPI0036126447
MNAHELLYPKPTPAYLCQIRSLGSQTVEEEGYHWDGLSREGGGFIFQYTLAGEGMLTLDNQTLPVRQNQAFLVHVPGNHSYSYDKRTGEPWSFLWIRIDYEQSQPYYEHLLGLTGHVFPIHAEAEPIRKLKQLCQEMNRKKDKYELALQAYEWMLSFTRWASGDERPSPQWPEPYERVAARIELHYYQPLSLDDLAAEAGLSRHHFCKAFRKLTGLTPMQYLRNKRIEQAAYLLSSTDKSIADIAVQTGFDTTSYFGKVFRSVVGRTPTEYREDRMQALSGRLRVLP